jgi:hypothetical protein
VTDNFYGFANFPSDFDSNSNFIVDILWDITNSDQEIASIIANNSFYFSGCYPQSNLLGKLLLRFEAEFSQKQMSKWLTFQNGIRKVPRGYTKSMWITFENRRPPSNYYQRTLSFDLDSFSGGNHYFPLWVSYIDFLGSRGSWVRHRVSQELLMQSREFSDRNRNFACAFINNPDPVRLRAIDMLKKIGPVEIFGRYSGRYVKDKIGLSKNYKFSVCFENDLYPGYVTEKPLEAWLGGTIPLYWGNDAENYINSSAVINYESFDGLADYVDYIYTVNKNIDLFAFHYQQPLLQKAYDVTALLEFFKSWIIE